ncbi:hypothetical protein [uncultured Bradyrhizobium sp.]|jgi:hypothetical protein|uniref:hypothetical protein n=1 Tax=uncultured Bradyrhizobium sp. TaxID=199684 RepID=UPI00260AA73A|nr:hypothetical protein [uncultured Bradyrhizobium sp.]
MTQRSKDSPPARVCARPDPAQWSDDELLTLSEAAALFWPMGPLTCTSLRTAVRDGKLEVAEIAGKLLTSKTSIAKMSRCDIRSGGVPTASEASRVVPVGAAAPQTVAEFRRMMAEGRI